MTNCMSSSISCPEAILLVDSKFNTIWNLSGYILITADIILTPVNHCSEWLLMQFFDVTKLSSRSSSWFLLNEWQVSRPPPFIKQKASQRCDGGANLLSITAWISLDFTPSLCSSSVILLPGRQFIKLCWPKVSQSTTCSMCWTNWTIVQLQPCRFFHKCNVTSLLTHRSPNKLNRRCGQSPSGLVLIKVKIECFEF